MILDNKFYNKYENISVRLNPSILGGGVSMPYFSSLFLKGKLFAHPFWVLSVCAYNVHH
jgi:hypothetical protein